MTAFLTWYLASSLLGWLAFPLVYRLFPALTDRGYTLARAAGLLLWGWLFWILASLGILRNDLGGLLFAFLLLITLSAVSLFGNALRNLILSQRDASRSEVEGTQRATRNTDHWSLITDDLKNWFSSNKLLLLTTELLFLLFFAFLAFVRSANPEIVATEKPMELAFINSILRSPTLPPNDPWLSGYAISYYHFGYILTAMLARLTAVPGSVAFNLMLALVFALAAVGSYGILYNLLCAYAGKHVDRYTSTQVNMYTAQGDTEHATRNPALSEVEGTNRQSPITNYWLLALLAPLFLLILSNAEGILEVIHGLGWFWPSTSNVQPSTFNFWTWLNIKELNTAPTGEGWIPDRFWWWWRASRVLSDFDLVGNFQEVIDEFPFFSFLLGDLHPHVLALPFNMLAIGVALNLFLGGWRGEINIFDFRLRTAPRDFLFTALVVGGLAFLNTWDILVAATLIVGAYLLVRVRDDGWIWGLLEDAFVLGIPLVIASVVLYLPFYIGFSSQAGGPLPNLVNPTRGAHLWVMWGTLLLPLFAWLIYLTRVSEPRPRLGAALAWTFGLILLLWASSWVMGLLARWHDPAYAMEYLASQGQPDLPSFFDAATARRFSYIGGLLTIASVFWLSLAHLIAYRKSQIAEPESNGTHHIHTYTSTHVDTKHATRSTYPLTPNPHPLSPDSNSSFILHPSSFVLLLTALASLLVLAPDFVYLRDQFGYRINTVFKFYYQAWQLWALAASFGMAVLLGSLRGVRNVVFSLLLAFVLVAGLAYPILGISNKTNNFDPPSGLTLDGADHLNRESPEDAAAIHYLQTAPLGVVAEAASPLGSYTNYARISTHTGLPTVLGWPFHESQWRGDSAPQGSREADLRTLYETPDWETAKIIIDRYQIRYIVVGFLEQTTYRVSETKFQQHLIVLFQVGNTVIYGVP